MDLTIPVALQASQPVGGQGHKQIERFIYNFIKHFGSSIGAGNNIQMLKLEELNVRKCIQLEILQDDSEPLGLISQAQKSFKNCKYSGEIVQILLNLFPIIKQIREQQFL